MAKVRTRIAPSPTGDPHVGTAGMRVRMSVVHMGHIVKVSAVISIENISMCYWKMARRSVVFVLLNAWMRLE
jgi:hypothetical protein